MNIRVIRISFIGIQIVNYPYFAASQFYNEYGLKLIEIWSIALYISPYGYLSILKKGNFI